MTLSSQAADFFAVLGDRTRIRILSLLHQKSLTAKQLQSSLGNISMPALSYQLQILTKSNFIRFEKDPSDGRFKRFQLADAHITHILNDALIHIQNGADCEGILDCESQKGLDLLEEIN
ncbi:MAG: ArsR/SmtB family transcription factor [Promethearchaeota archaeon]